VAVAGRNRAREQALAAAEPCSDRNAIHDRGMGDFVGEMEKSTTPGACEMATLVMAFGV
jgi:hypothetical protein